MPKKLGLDRSLTTREQSIVNYIRQKIEESGYPPTVREICNAVGLRSTSTVHGYLGRLEKMGVIKRDPASSRAIELTEDMSWRHKKIIPTPVVGAVRAGDPIVADEHIETVLPLPAELIGNQNCFILTVRGDSMINAGILSGDKVVVRPQPSADDGQIVVARIEDEATVKRLRRRSGQIWLMPENDNYSPIDGTNAEIIGIVKAVVREY